MTEWERKCLVECSKQDWTGLYGIGIRLLDVDRNFVSVADVMKTEWLAATSPEQRLEIVQKAITNAR